jgi:hypothetical protein
MSEFGGFWVKIHGGPFQAAGLPDLYGLVSYITFWIEVKRGRGKATALQLKTILDLRKAGAVADVVTSVEEAVELVGKNVYGKVVSLSKARFVLHSDEETRSALHVAQAREGRRNARPSSRTFWKE